MVILSPHVKIISRFFVIPAAGTNGSPGRTGLTTVTLAAPENRWDQGFADGDYRFAGI
jgi:hypothetical protein